MVAFDGLLKLALQIVTGDLVSRMGWALLEVLCVGTLGVTPLLAASFLDIHAHATFQASVASLKQLVGLGQLFLYAFALTGTLLWLLFARTGGAHVLFRVLLGISTLIVAIVAVSIFMQDPHMATKLSDFLVAVSVACFIICLINYFFLLMCESAPPKRPAEAIRRDIDRLVGGAGGAAS